MGIAPLAASIPVEPDPTARVLGTTRSDDGRSGLGARHGSILPANRASSADTDDRSATRYSHRDRTGGGRGDWIRTSDLLNPIQVRYQAALRPVGTILAVCPSRANPQPRIGSRSGAQNKDWPQRRLPGPERPPRAPDRGVRAVEVMPEPAHRASVERWSAGAGLGSGRPSPRGRRKRPGRPREAAFVLPRRTPVRWGPATSADRRCHAGDAASAQDSLAAPPPGPPAAPPARMRRSQTS